MIDFKRDIYKFMVNMVGAGGREKKSKKVLQYNCCPLAYIHNENWGKVYDSCKKNERESFITKHFPCLGSHSEQ